MTYEIEIQDWQRAGLTNDPCENNTWDVESWEVIPMDESIQIFYTDGFELNISEELLDENRDNFPPDADDETVINFLAEKYREDAEPVEVA